MSTSRSAGRSKTSRRHSRGLEEDRERRVTRRDFEESGHALALLPERCALARSPAGEEQHARAAFSLKRLANSDVLGTRVTDELVELLGIDEQDVERDLVERLGKAADDAVVAPQHLYRQVEARQLLLDRQRPRRVHPRSRTG